MSGRRPTRSIGFWVMSLALMTQITIYHATRHESLLASALNAIALFTWVVGVVALVSARSGRRRLGGKEQARLFRRAWRSGRVPPEADATRWRPVLEKRRRDLSARWAIPATQLVILVPVALSVQLGTSWEPTTRWSSITIVLACGAFIVTAALRASRQGLARAAQLPEQLPHPVQKTEA